MTAVTSVTVGRTTIRGVVFESGYDESGDHRRRWCRIDGVEVSGEAFEAALADAKQRAGVESAREHLLH